MRYSASFRLRSFWKMCPIVLPWFNLQPSRFVSFLFGRISQQFEFCNFSLVIEITVANRFKTRISQKCLGKRNISLRFGFVIASANVVSFRFLFIFSSRISYRFGCIFDRSNSVWFCIGTETIRFQQPYWVYMGIAMQRRKFTWCIVINRFSIEIAALRISRPRKRQVSPVERTKYRNIAANKLRFFHQVTFTSVTRLHKSPSSRRFERDWWPCEAFVTSRTHMSFNDIIGYPTRRFVRFTLYFCCWIYIIKKSYLMNQ